MTSATRLDSRPRGARAPAGKVFLAAAALAVAGCASPAFRASVGQFGTLTKAGVAAQNVRLQGIVADEQERIRTDLAGNRVDLRLDPACAATLTAQTTGAVAQCRLVRADGRPLETPPNVDHVLALSAALSDYSDNLIALAADSTDDQQALATSINTLGTSLGKLEGEVREATGAPPGQSRDEIGAVAAVVSEAGGLYLGYRRSRALRRLVIAGDPIVQKAVETLVRLQLRIRQYDRTTLFAQVQAAQQRATQLANTSASAATLRTAQDALFAALAANYSAAADVAAFVAIGEAHAGLAQAARAGASPAQMAAAIEAILHLAGTIHDSVETLSGDSAETPGGGSGSN